MTSSPSSSRFRRAGWVALRENVRRYSEVIFFDPETAAICLDGLVDIEAFRTDASQRQASCKTSINHSRRSGVQTASQRKWSIAIVEVQRRTMELIGHFRLIQQLGKFAHAAEPTGSPPSGNHAIAGVSIDQEVDTQKRYESD